MRVYQKSKANILTHTMYILYINGLCKSICIHISTRLTLDPPGWTKIKNDILSSQVVQVCWTLKRCIQYLMVHQRPFDPTKNERRVSSLPKTSMFRGEIDMSFQGRGMFSLIKVRFSSWLAVESPL